MQPQAIYLDNAATSWPKPPCVAQAMTRFLTDIGANPGRAAHRRANESARIVYEAREQIAKLFSVNDPLRVVFGSNVTEALNLALTGMLKPGDHVITGSMEHNSMMRPLRFLEQQGVALTVVPCSPHGFPDPADFARAIRQNTTLIALNHASNVVGSIADIRSIGRIAHEHDIHFLVDTAQSAGALEIDMTADAIDLLAFTGHKSLYGPMGTGGLIIGERVDPTRLRPLKRGGTGSKSQHEEQPDFLPDAFESGTPNVVGLAGLAASVTWLRSIGVAGIRDHECRLTQRLTDGLRAIEGVQVYGGLDATRQVANVSFTVHNTSVSTVTQELDEHFGIMCRGGLHCAPSAHKSIGTFPHGTVRFGIGYFTTEREIDTAIAAVQQIADTK